VTEITECFLMWLPLRFLQLTKRGTQPITQGMTKHPVGQFFPGPSLIALLRAETAQEKKHA
jgi:hypothetical protein